MSTTPLVPQAFWFRVAIPCNRMEEIPRTKGGLLDLPTSCKIVRPSRLDDRPDWADVRVAWNARGLGISVAVSGKVGPVVHDPFQPELSDRVQLWIDTRDTRDVHRATRYCHKFTAELIPTKRGSDLRAEVAQQPIHRALADAPKTGVEAIQSRAEAIRKGWRLELFFPAASLNGFDPETNRRLGFYFQVSDPDRGDQFLGVGREFPVGEDPSLWATLELRDDG